IQHDQAGRARPEEEPLARVAPERPAEDAPVVPPLCPDVRHAPRGPEDLHPRATWLVDRLRVVGSPGLAVDAQPQALPDLEERDALRMHRDEGAGLRVAPLARLAMLHHEAAESPDLDALAAHEGLGEALEHLVDDDLGVATREARKELHHLVDEIALRHGGLSPRIGRPASSAHRSAPPPPRPCSARAP